MVVGIFIDKVQALGKCGIEVMLIRVLYFVVPLITAGVTENPKARPPAVIAALLGLAYVFGTWFFVLNSDACPREARDTVILLPLSLHFARQWRHKIIEVESELVSGMTSPACK